MPVQLVCSDMTSWMCPDTVRFAVNPFTGAIDELTVEGDKHHMNWIVKTDGSQYPWITERYSWGLGYFTQVKGHESLKRNGCALL